MIAALLKDWLFPKPSPLIVDPVTPPSRPLDVRIGVKRYMCGSYLGRLALVWSTTIDDQPKEYAKGHVWIETGRFEAGQEVLVRREWERIEFYAGYEVYRHWSNSPEGAVAKFLEREARKR